MLEKEYKSKDHEQDQRQLTRKQGAKKTRWWRLWWRGLQGHRRAAWHEGWDHRWQSQPKKVSVAPCHRHPWWSSLKCLEASSNLSPRLLTNKGINESVIGQNWRSVSLTPKWEVEYRICFSTLEANREGRHRQLEQQYGGAENRVQRREKTKKKIARKPSTFFVSWEERGE